MVRKSLINSLATVTKSTVPIRGQPGQIALKDLGTIEWVGKFEPIPGEVIFKFGHKRLKDTESK